MNAHNSDVDVELGEILSENNISSTESNIDSDRYIIRKFLGRGTWGKVHSAYDKLMGIEVAVKEYDPTELAKEQARERKVTEKSFMKSEALAPNSYRNIAPRQLMSDNNGKPFLVTKKYDKFLSDILLDDTIRASFKNKNLSLNRLLSIGVDLAYAIADLHTIGAHPKIHGDIKSDNVGIEYSNSAEKAELSDFGNATTADIGFSNKKTQKKNSGFLYTRAPEKFYYKDSNEEIKSWFNSIDISVQTQNDVWSVGALISRMYTGKYPLEDIINSADIPEKTVRNLSDKEFNKAIKKSTKGMPHDLKKVIKKALNRSVYGRYKNGKEFLNDLEEVKSKYENKYHALKDFWKWTKRLAIPVTAVSFFSYFSLIHEPTEITLPNITQGQMLTVGSMPSQGILFEKEDKTVYAPDPEMMIHGNAFNNMSDNAYAVHLMRQYRVALDYSENRMNGANEYQYQLWLNTTTVDQRQFHTPLTPIMNAIEISMNNNYLNGVIDLEDVCVESHISSKRMHDAKKISGSQDYHDYKWAKYNNGTFVIKKNERNFIDTWLRNIELKEYSIPNRNTSDSSNVTLNLK
ncbi:MAG: protein kinase domain-containing protein [Candidatus Woesearchaeota archaeon]